MSLTTDEKVVALLERQNRLLEKLSKGTDRQREDSQADFSSIRLLVALGIAFAATFYPPMARLAQNPAGVIQGLDGIYLRELEVGMTIASFPVTSGFGPRTSPTAGASTNHRGVDLATPTGTALYMVGDGTVKCASQPSGAGLWATIEPNNLPFTFRAMHLDNCQSGQYKSGELWGRTGNSGTSTGPHLHWEQLSKGVHVKPTEGFLWWALQGKPPQPIAPTVQGGIGELDKLYSAIVLQESGGNSKAINPHTGALGKGQIMPENVGPWSKECLGRKLTPDQLLAAPEIQKEIIQCKHKQYLNAAKKKRLQGQEACRYVASAWYSGDGDLRNSDRPQYSGGKQYPSIADYTRSVCKGFGIR